MPDSSFFFFCFLLGYWHGPQEDMGSGAERKLVASLKVQTFLEGLCRGRWDIGGPSHRQAEQKEAVGHQLRMGQQTCLGKITGKSSELSLLPDGLQL